MERKVRFKVSMYGMEILLLEYSISSHSLDKSHMYKKAESLKGCSLQITDQVSLLLGQNMIAAPGMLLLVSCIFGA